MKEIQVGGHHRGSKKEIALVDDGDYESVSKYRWSVQKHGKTFYAVHTIPHPKKKRIFMHRFITGVTDTKIVIDHIDHNGLNNQRNNLRKCTQSQNMINKAGFGKSNYKGVYKNSKNSYVAMAFINGKTKYIGSFNTSFEAATARDKVVILESNPFDLLNFPIP